MGCGCGQRAVEAFEKAGYYREYVDGIEWLVKGDDRVQLVDVLNHHARETFERPEVTTAAIREAARKARERAAGLLNLLKTGARQNE